MLLTTLPNSFVQLRTIRDKVRDTCFYVTDYTLLKIHAHKKRNVNWIHVLLYCSIFDGCHAHLKKKTEYFIDRRNVLVWKLNVLASTFFICSKIVSIFSFGHFLFHQNLFVILQEPPRTPSSFCPSLGFLP